jgi:hypothetical protein
MTFVTCVRLRYSDMWDPYPRRDSTRKTMSLLHFGFTAWWFQLREGL